jgi:hypothetical protein
MATHLIVKKSGDDGAYPSIASAIAGTSSGSSGEWSTITINDDEIYDELIDFGELDYVKIIAADNCIIAPTYAVSPVTMGSTAPANIQFDVANGARPTLAPAASQAEDLPIFAWGDTHPVALLVSGWRFRPTAGTGWLIAEGKAPGSVLKLDSCEASDGPWTTNEILKLDKAASLTVLDCNMENVKTAEVFAQIGPETVVGIHRSSIEADTLLAIEGPTPGTGGQLDIINNMFFLSDKNVVFLDLSDGVNTTGGLIAHNLFMRLGGPNTLVTAIKTPYSNVDVNNNIFIGLGTVGTIDGAVTATANNNCVYDCNAGFVGNWAEVGTVIADPKLGDGGDLEPDSPCIDAGVDIPTVTVDIMGRPRPSPEGGKWDIGPCEFQGTPTPGPDGESVDVPAELGKPVYYTADGELITSPDSGDSDDPTEVYAQVPTAVFDRHTPSIPDGDGYVLALVTLTGPRT